GSAWAATAKAQRLITVRKLAAVGWPRALPGGFAWRGPQAAPPWGDRPSAKGLVSNPCQAPTARSVTDARHPPSPPRGRLRGDPARGQFLGLRRGGAPEVGETAPGRDGAHQGPVAP